MPKSARPSAGSKSSRSSGDPIARVVAYIGLGSNLGDRRKHLRDAVRELRATSDVTVTGMSGIYETSPVDASGGPYLNAAVRVVTRLAPYPLLNVLLGIERRLGRVRYGV